MAVNDVPETIIPDPEFGRTIEGLSGEKLSSCFQCAKCSNGCPITFAMDISPHKLLRLIQYGQVDKALRSDTIWVCASCETCTTRCPNGIDIAHLMDTLRQLSQSRGIEASQSSVPIFHSAFLSSIKKRGRVHETEMALTYSIQDVGLFGAMKLAGLGLNMFLKGKVKLIPSRVKAINSVRHLFRKAEGIL